MSETPITEDQYREWFVTGYDTDVADTGDAGAAVAKSRDARAHAYADAVEAGDLPAHRMDLVDQGRDLFDRFVTPERERRRTAMRGSAGHLVDALRGDTVLGAEDPVLARAYPLGTGLDKTLNRWTAEDWRAASTERYRNAASVTAAAREFDGSAETIITALQERGLTTTGELFAPPPIA